MSWQVLLAGWIGGMVLGSLMLFLWDWLRPSPDKALSILGLLLWFAASLALAMLLAQWWMPVR